MTDGFTLDQPEQINMWVLLSRRHQIKMHERFPVKGLLTCLKREFGNHGNRVANYIVPVEFAISEGGGDVDYSRVNVHIMQIMDNGLFFDRGIYASMDEAGTFENRALFAEGKIECVLTLDEPRPENGRYFTPA